MQNHDRVGEFVLKCKLKPSPCTKVGATTMQKESWRDLAVPFLLQIYPYTMDQDFSKHLCPDLNSSKSGVMLSNFLPHCRADLVGEQGAYTTLCKPLHCVSICLLAEGSPVLVQYCLHKPLPEEVPSSLMWLCVSNVCSYPLADEY